MDDKQLLELAAKAAGYTVIRYEAGYGLAIEGSGVWWFPLGNSGQALDLAVKLKITPNIDGNLTEAVSHVGYETEPHFDDPYAATRRAIVRAAAAIATQEGE